MGVRVSTANRGKPWEADLSEQHDLYRRLGWAEVESLQAPYQVLGVMGRGFFKGQFRGKGRSDFFGSIVTTGPVYFDAKSTHAARWAFANLEREQALFLDARPRTLTALAIRWEFIGQPWRSVWLPWSALRPVWRAWQAGDKRASVTVEEAIEMGGREFRGADWLGVARG